MSKPYDYEKPLTYSGLPKQGALSYLRRCSLRSQVKAALLDILPEEFAKRLAGVRRVGSDSMGGEHRQFTQPFGVLLFFFSVKKDYLESPKAFEKMLFIF